MSDAQASDVVRRFRIWRMQHRSQATTQNLAIEIGIPEKIVKNIMLGKTDASVYMQRLTAFLEAFARGDSGIMIEIAQASEHLPDPHASRRYTIAALRTIKARQLKQVEDMDRPYCLLAKQDIAPRQCILAQNARECIGCASNTKFCLECGYDRVAFTGSDLCGYCLTRALNDPDTDARTSVLPVKVVCPQSGGQRISIATCQRLQGSACGSCSAATRICLDCKERRVRYPSFGQCLKCYTALMAPPDWQPITDTMLAIMQGLREKFLADNVAAAEKPVTLLVTAIEQIVHEAEIVEPAFMIQLPQISRTIHPQHRKRYQRLFRMIERLPLACESHLPYKEWAQAFIGDRLEFESRGAFDQFINKAYKDELILFQDERYWAPFNWLRFNVERIKELATTPTEKIPRKRKRMSFDEDQPGMQLLFEVLLDKNNELSARVAELEALLEEQAQAKNQEEE